MIQGRFSVKGLIIACCLVVVSGCAAHGKTDQQIYQEALGAVAEQAGRADVGLSAVVIQSHGMIADGLTVAAGGGQNAAQLRQALHKVRQAGEPGFLIMGGNGALDTAVMKGACTGQDFSGLTIVFAGTPEQQSTIQDVVQKTQANFRFISRQ